ncbi:MAG: glycosyltransferase [Saprospiraceae bacterium]|nr:glycosyltransferase [Saprospiraceae bacterium]
MEYYFNAHLVISALLTLGYIVVMYQYIKGWKMLPTWEVPPHYIPHTKVSIIIPARDEEKSILNCLSSIVQQNYPTLLWEVIVVDDHSTDQTVDLVSSLAHPNVKLLRLADFVQEGETKAYKKKAIEVAIAASTGSLIVTTDADCVVQPNC